MYSLGWAPGRHVVVGLCVLSACGINLCAAVGADSVRRNVLKDYLAAGMGTYDALIKIDTKLAGKLGDVPERFVRILHRRGEYLVKEARTREEIEHHPATEEFSEMTERLDAYGVISNRVWRMQMGRRESELIVGFDIDEMTRLESGEGYEARAKLDARWIEFAGRPLLRESIRWTSATSFEAQAIAYPKDVETKFQGRIVNSGGNGKTAAAFEVWPQSSGKNGGDVQRVEIREWYEDKELGPIPRRYNFSINSNGETAASGKVAVLRFSGTVKREWLSYASFFRKFGTNITFFAELPGGKARRVERRGEVGRYLQSDGPVVSRWVFVFGIALIMLAPIAYRLTRRLWSVKT